MPGVVILASSIELSGYHHQQSFKVSKMPCTDRHREARTPRPDPRDTWVKMVREDLPEKANDCREGIA